MRVGTLPDLVDGVLAKRRRLIHAWARYCESTPAGTIVQLGRHVG